MSVSLVVHAGGRWRAVEPGRGALCVARRGRLLALRHVQPDKLALGPALPYKYRRPQPASSDSDGSLEPSQTKHKSRQRTNYQKASVAVQCGASPDAGGAPPRRGSKRRRSSSSEAPPPQPRTFTTLAIVHADKHQHKKSKTEALHLKRKRPRTSSEDLPVNTSPQRNLSFKRQLGPSKRTSPSKEHSPILTSRDTANQTHKLNNQRDQHKKPSKSKDATSSYEVTSQRRDQQIMSLLKSTDESDFETVKIKKQKLKSSNADKAFKHKLGPNEAQDRSSTDEPTKLAVERSTNEPTTLRHKRAKLTSIDESVKRTKRTIDNSGKESVQISPKKSIERSSTNEPLTHKKGPKRAKDRTTKGLEPKKEMAAADSESQSSYKELVIEERDVELIRRFLQRHHPDEDLLRFDTDDQYKTMYFYRINPLVSVERCPRIATMIRAASQRRLLHFASKLGLRSVSETSSTKRYRTRRREEKSYALDSSDAEDKENIDKPAPPTKTVGTGEVLRESLYKGLNRARRKKERGIAGTFDTVELSSANESDHEKVAGRKEVKKPQPMKPKVMKPKVISTKRAACKEYSNLEDHAIVAWVSSGARASSVNGNRLWRQLQEQYPRLTGQGRTWHSLRNRYLRYILPRLAALALPHALQARLRAAAATGELKARKKQPRRNSMFPPPARGASSRRPRPLAVPSQDEHAAEPPTKDNTGGERSPRYSALTRQWARARTERSGTTRSSPTSTAATNNRASDAPAPSPAPSPARNNSRGTTRRNSSESETTGDSSSESSERRSPIDRNRRRSNRLNFAEPNGPTSNRHSSPSESDRRKSNRRSSPIEINRRRSNRLNSPSETNRHKSNRRNVDEPKRPTNRHNSPTETSSRRSNRQNSPSESNRRTSKRHKPRESNRRNSPIEANGRESNRRYSSSDSSASGSPEPGRDPVATRRRTLALSARTLTSPARTPRPRLRKLFNHRAVF